MGKARKRGNNIAKHNQFSTMTRQEAIEKVLLSLKNKSDEYFDLISLFGLSGEELLEAGAFYEDVVALKGVIDV